MGCSVGQGAACLFWPSRKSTMLPLLLRLVLNFPKKFILILEGLHSICVILKVFKQHLQISLVLGILPFFRNVKQLVKDGTGR